MDIHSPYIALKNLSLCLLGAYIFIVATTMINISLSLQYIIAGFQSFYGYVHFLVLAFLVVAVTFTFFRMATQKVDEKSHRSIIYYWIAGLIFPIIGVLLEILKSYFYIGQADFYTTIIWIMIPSLLFPCWITANKTANKFFYALSLVDLLIICCIILFLPSYTNAFLTIANLPQGILATLFYQIPLLIYAVNFMLAYKFLNQGEEVH